MQEALVRKKVMQILKAHGYDLAKSREMEIGLANTGALLDNDEGFAKVAKELALSAIVTGEIGKKRAKISVHDGKDGSLLGDANFAGANPRKIMAEVGRDFWKKLGGEIERGKSPSGAKKPQKVAAPSRPKTTRPRPTPPAVKAARARARARVPEEGGRAGRGGRGRRRGRRRRSAQEEEEEKEEGRTWKAEGRRRGARPARSSRRRSTLRWPARLINRSLAYNDDISSPRACGRTRCRPARRWSPTSSGSRSAPFTDGALKNLGVEGHIEQAFLVSSTLPPHGLPERRQVRHRRPRVSRRRPLPRCSFGAGNYFFGSLTGGEHAFTFHSTTADRRPCNVPRSTSPTPSIVSSARASGCTSSWAVALSVGVAAGFRWVFNKGGQFHDEFFKHASVNGVDAQVKVGYRSTPMFELRAFADWRRYFSSMNCLGDGRRRT